MAEQWHLSINQFFKQMIQCSPQQFLAQTLTNCYRFSSANKQSYGLKKAIIVRKQQHSPRLLQKRSLKQILNTHRNSQESNSLQKNRKKANSINSMQKIIQEGRTANEVGIENRKKENKIRICNYQNQINQLQNRFANARHIEEYYQVKNSLRDVRSGLQTHCSSFITEQLYSKASNLTFGNDFNSAQKVQMMGNSETFSQYQMGGKKIIKRTSTLNSLQPKLAQSTVNQSIFQDQYSEVINSHAGFPIKIGVQKFNRGLPVAQLLR